jgi:transcriptional regulator
MTPDHTQAKKGMAEMLVLSVLDGRPRHGYDITQIIGQRSGGVLEYHAASLYPVLYRLEARKWISAKWVEKAGERRRRFYSLTPQGRRMLADQRRSWAELAGAISKVTEFGNA